MLLLIHLILVSLLNLCILSEDILLPSLIIKNQSLSSFYLCHVHQLKNPTDFFLQGYRIINGGTTGHVHHLLIYECSIKDKLQYSGLCGMYASHLMPSPVYRHCQTRIVIAWAQGGQLQHDYPNGTGLKMSPHTQLLLEVHFEPSIPTNHSVGIHLKFYPFNRKPRFEIGLLTLGTLAHSPIFLPPGLRTIRFPTYCFNNCLKYYLNQTEDIHIFSILLHAHRHATRIILKTRLADLIDQNPFRFHQQENIYFNEPYPRINSTDELSLICHYSTFDEHSKPIYGGYNSNDEMCQAFLYYYPKIESFPLCLSVPIYRHKQILNHTQNWTTQLSLRTNYELESNQDHLSLCGDNIFLNNTNQTMLHTHVYQRSMETTKQYLNVYPRLLCFFYPTLLLFLLISTMHCCLFIKKYLHCFSNGGTLSYS